MSFSRSTSSASMSTAPSTSTSTNSHTRTMPSSNSIASLPSFAHSLSSFPNMTSVSNDMVHYGTLARTKNVSEAKLNTVLQTTRQRKNGYSQGPPYPGAAAPLANMSNSPSFDDDSALTISRKKRNSFTKDAAQS